MLFFFFNNLKKDLRTRTRARRAFLNLRITFDVIFIRIRRCRQKVKCVFFNFRRNNFRRNKNHFLFLFFQDLFLKIKRVLLSFRTESNKNCL